MYLNECIDMVCYELCIRAGYSKQECREKCKLTEEGRKGKSIQRRYNYDSREGSNKKI